MEKLIVMIMGQNTEKFLPMCIKSVKGSDKIIFCDGGSIDKTHDICMENNVQVISNEYNQEDKTMNGKQRNFYLNYLKENYPDDWALCLDADEVVEDIQKIKEFIKVAKYGVYSVKMRHFIGDLGNEDATQNEHFVLNRLFKINQVENYPEVEHPVLVPKGGVGGFNETTIWHLSYIPNMWNIRDKYRNHLKKSNMHTPDYLKNWYWAHIFGQYPKRRINILDIPEIILDEFLVDKNELYFLDRRNYEIKHYQDCIDWKNYFKCESAIEFGAGMGQRTEILNKIGVKTTGIELSKYAVKNNLSESVIKGSITDDKDYGKADLTIAYDVLEHLEYDDLDKSINKLISNSNKYILVSIPVKGNPSLDADKTHIIKEIKEWWLNKFLEKGLKQIETPKHFQYSEQIYIFEKHLNTLNIQ